MPAADTSPFDLQVEQDALLGRQRLMQAMLGPLLQSQQGQMVSGHFVAPSPLQHLAQIAGGYMQGQFNEQNLQDRKALTGKYNNALSAGLQKYFATRDGTPGQVMTTEQADALLNHDQAPELTEPTPANPRRAAIEALTSSMAPLRELGKMDLAATLKQDSTPETFGHTPVTEKDAVGKLISVLYGNKGTRRVVSDAVPYEKPISIADRLVDPANPQQPIADYETKGGKVITDERGDKYQIMSNGAWKKLDNSAKVTVNNSTTIQNKGEEEFSKVLGRDVAEEFKKARTDAQTAYKTKATVGQLRELEKNGVFSGPTANVATTLASIGETLRLPVDSTKLANSQAYQQQFAQQVANVLTSGSGVGRSMTDEDRKAFERSLPSLLLNPAGRQQVFRMMEASADAQITRAKSFQQRLVSNPLYKDYAGMLTLNPVDEAPAAPAGGVQPPGAPVVPGVGAPMSLDDYLRAKGVH